MLSWISCTLHQRFWTRQWRPVVDLWAFWNCLPCSLMLSKGSRSVLVYRLKPPGSHSLFWSDGEWKILSNREVPFPVFFSLSDVHDSSSPSFLFSSFLSLLHFLFPFFLHYHFLPLSAALCLCLSLLFIFIVFLLLFQVWPITCKCQALFCAMQQWLNFTTTDLYSRRSQSPAEDDKAWNIFLPLTVGPLITFKFKARVKG